MYQYEMDISVEGEETVLHLTAPDTVSGFTARVTGEDSVLEYDGVWVETGPLDESGLTPVSALPALLEEARSGYITACALEEDGALLRVDLGDPAGSPGTGLPGDFIRIFPIYHVKKGDTHDRYPNRPHLG